MLRGLKIYLLLVPFLLFTQSCGLYSLGGVKIPDKMKTVTVEFFENNSPLVVATLSQQFTEALKERIRNQSKLSIVRTNGDAVFEGRITDYNIRPMAVGGNDRASLNRLTITVSVKYTNSLDETQSFEEPFSAFKDVPATQTVQSQEASLIRDINVQLTENIFNRAFANW